MIIKSLNTANGKIIVSFEQPNSNETKRSFEKRIIIHLLSLLDIDPANLHYGKKGNPELLGSPTNISISHSKGWFAIYTGNIPVGIDIQEQKSRISLGKSFFLNKNENQWSSNLDLHLVWSTKEAIYKILKGEVGDVIMDITVLEIDHLNHKIKAQYFESRIELIFEEIDTTLLVYN